MAARKNKTTTIKAVFKASSKQKQLSNKKDNVLVALTSREALPADKNDSMERGGIVFVKHLPHGLFEMELQEFFQQFGEVLKVFVGRSKRTQRSKGYGYVQFRYFEIAKIAASAVANYLFFGRSLQAQVLPKKTTVIPRNCTKALDNKGRHTVGYTLWLQKQATRVNGYVEGVRLRERRKEQAVKVKKALADLQQAGTVLPEIHPCYVDLTHSAEAKKQLERIEMIRNFEEGVTNDESSDGEDAFVPLQPSDWCITDRKPSGSDGNNHTSKQDPIQKAKDTLEAFEN